ncbi:hypothetical protein ElyMa_000833800 [Elysia marginata]|uniref:Uncharacterized protein n=1 Tax=Elysia marginata TaxID=1093978 RepID=A0AAV4H0X6_9GAST|nr:hypothetical protein ElyMa_000833800 [Elysia marginata]
MKILKFLSDKHNAAAAAEGCSRDARGKKQSRQDEKPLGTASSLSRPIGQSEMRAPGTPQPGTVHLAARPSTRKLGL